MVTREINTYLFGVEKFDMSEQFFLNRVIDSKKGNCLGLSTLYLSIADKLHLPIYCVYLPGHVILRWDDGEYRRNIDPAMMGCEFSDDYYTSKYNLPKKCLKEGVYLKNLSKKEMIAVLLNSRGSDYAGKKRYEKALKDYNQALVLKPNLVGGYHNKGDVYLNKGDFERAIMEYNKALSINPNYTNSIMAKECAYKLKEGLPNVRQESL
jgi:regulator of sirC expression with transglutaminase-like and TPR domain